MSEIRIILIICSVIAFVIAIVCHEVMHGFVAYKLGDPTAKRQGRLSLNPLKHVDPFGTVILPALMIFSGGPVFGYAKPVPYNPNYFKDKQKGEILVGLAGPFANLILALVGALLLWLLSGLFSSIGYTSFSSCLSVGDVIGSIGACFYQLFLPYFVLINLYLMFFNLIPIPPLDGSSIIGFLLPKKYLPQYYKVQQYALPIFLIIIFVLPYFLHIDLIGWYLNLTAGNLALLLMP